MDERTVLAMWPLSSPVTIGSAASGTNNQTFYVDADDGEYVARVYQNTRDPVRINYEHLILRALAARSLTFLVPSPLVGRRGSTVVMLDDGSCAALFSRITGDPPDRRNSDHLKACGAALAELHEALRRLDLGPPPLDLGMYGDLDRVHPLVADAWSLPSILPVSNDQRVRLEGMFAGLRTVVPSLYATLPMQVCHNDYSPGNTLQIGGRTSGILDFEFAAPDVRAIDVAVGWYWSVGAAWGTGDEQRAAQAFLRGYASTGTITGPEANAMPTLSLLHRVVALVHSMGRTRAGLASHDLLIEQARRLLHLDRWLKDHGDEIRGFCVGAA
jgi:homoserine kinase type II